MDLFYGFRSKSLAGINYTLQNESPFLRFILYLFFTVIVKTDNPCKDNECASLIELPLF